MKKVMYAFISLFTLLIIGGCQANKETSHKQFINDKEIVANDDSFKFSDSDEKQYDANGLVTHTTFDGLNTLWLVSVSAEDNIKINFDTKLTKGELKMVVTAPDKSVKTVFEGSKKGEFSEKLTKGKYKIKLVGDNATADLNIKVEVGKNSTVKKYDSVDELDKEIDKEIDNEIDSDTK